MHHPHSAGHLDRAMISANALRGRISDFPAPEWILDSGAFTQLSTHGCFVDTPREYACAIKRWARCGDLKAAVTQDYMCEPWVLDSLGNTVIQHQRRTVARYDAICSELANCGSGIYLMPVLQGWQPDDYADHIKMYSYRLRPNAWVGVGSVCKRNSSPADVLYILRTIKKARPDLRLHGFGVKATALRFPGVRDLLHSADSMAWSYAARKQGRDANDPAEAVRWTRQLMQPKHDAPLFR